MKQRSTAWFLGLDIGTSSAKAVAFNCDGEVLAQAAVAYELEQPEPDAAVQDAETVRKAVLNSLRELVARMGYPPLAIGLSSAMHSLLATDREGNALSPLITWADGRAQPYAAQLRGSDEGRSLYRRSGTPIHAMSPLCKLAWLRDRQPDVFKQANRFAGIKDYVLFHLFGTWWIDHSLASATGLFDLHSRTWLPEALAYAQIDPARLPLPVPTHYRLPALSTEKATDLGLLPETPWVIGASDGCLANLGAGVIRSDEAVLTIGTSGAVRMTVPTAHYDPEERIFCYILDDAHYVIGGATNNGGVVWEWFCRQFFPDLPMPEVFRLVSGVAPGAEGLLFLPYLYGERAPVWDASAKGYFWEIEAHHSRAHFARAVLEGICLNIRQITEALESVGGQIHRIHANGGFVQSPVWVQLLSDVLGKEIAVGDSPHASAWGAALVAMQATGHPLPGSPMQADKEYQPDPARHQRYQEVFSRFKRIYPSARVS